jgi:cytochrome c peroxidase
VDIRPGNPVDLGTPLKDPVFNLDGVNIRRVAARNTPSVINAAFNFTNFWDGRANNVFNGVNPFGAADRKARIFSNRKAGATEVLSPVVARIRNASLASQATGPPLSDFEMSFRGRTWPKIGKKMLSLPPLALQVVHPDDSVLGAISASTAATRAKGLRTTYDALIRKAFAPKYWNNQTHMVTFSAAGVPKISRRPAGALTTNQYTQMEANFSLFFGLAVQLYEATLIANDSPFDRFLEGSGAQTQQEAQGLATFDGSGNCTACHAGGELTNASVTEMLVNPDNPFLLPNARKNPTNAIDFMSMLNGMAFYDTGFYNIGVRRTTEDISRGGNSPFRNPAAPKTNIPLSFSKLALLKFNSLLPPAIDLFAPPLPLGLLPTDTAPRPRRTDVNGAFKVPSLRNVELTGPYMHNGGHLTLAQVVDFYTRGGDFAAANVDDFSPNVNPIGKLRNSPARMNEVVAFLLSLTDPRVKNESAPFDHPELLVPNGANPTTGEDAQFLRIPAVGNGGRPADGLAPLRSFMGANPFAS